MNDTLNLLFALAKKKKKYNGRIMFEQVKPSGRLRAPERINLGGKSLGLILRSLGDYGWKTNPEALESVDLNTMIIQGNMQGAVFWHQPPNVVSGNQTVFRGPHKDILQYKGYSLVRDCPTEGQKEISSAVVES